MSTIRFFDVPHVVRYGKTDDTEETTWIRFYRNGTCFEVSVNRKDISGTQFEQEWLQYLAPPQRGGPPGAWVSRWNDFCDLVISCVLSKLQELAPTGQHSWTTYADYINTTTYELSIHKLEDGDSSSEVSVRIDSGPTLRPAYELQPQSMTMVDLPEDLPVYQASELRVLNQAKDLRQPPHKVVTPDETVAYLLPAERASIMHPGGQKTHRSMSEIAAQLSIHRLLSGSGETQKYIKGVPKVLASVTTISRGEVDSTVASELDAAQSEPETLFAGILLTYLPHARPLGYPSVLSLIANSRNPDQLRSHWYQSLSETIRTLHTSTIHGNINPYAILLSSNDYSFEGLGHQDMSTLQPCLTRFSNEKSSHLYVDPANEGTKEADWEGLRNIFGDHGWLVHEIKKLNGEINQQERWQRKSASQSV